MVGNKPGPEKLYPKKLSINLTQLQLDMLGKWAKDRNRPRATLVRALLDSYFIEAREIIK